MNVILIVAGAVWLALAVSAAITSAPSIVFWSFLIIANIYTAMSMR